MQLPGVEAHTLMNFAGTVTNPQIGPGKHVDVPTDCAFGDRKNNEQSFRPRLVLRVTWVELVIIGRDQGILSYVSV